jgi:UDP-N-acetylmuramoylalanine--D-glutamate ligase
LTPPFPGKKLLVRRKDIPSAPGQVGRSPRGAFLLSTKDLVWSNGEIKEEYDLRYMPIYGLNNRDNLMYAVCVAKELGVAHADIQKAIHEFPGVPHRLQLVRKKGGVRFINDSRSTNPDSLYKSIESFQLDPIILIAGGKQAADANFTPLIELVKKRVKTLILVGESKEQINRDIGDFSETFLVGTFEEAILLSYQKSREGDVILLSPGCESYDMFHSYEERGRYFTKYLDEI